MRQLARRDLLHALLGTPLAARILAGCDRHAPPRAVVGELLGPDMTAGHRLRDDALHQGEAFSNAPRTHAQVVVVGGGAAGLAAAWQLRRRGVEDVVVLELEDKAGGTARADHSAVTAYPWGAHYLPLPMPHNRPLLALLEEMGALEGRDRRGMPIGAEHLLVREPESRVFHQGVWHEGLYVTAGATRRDLEQRQHFYAKIAELAAARDGRGRRAFTIPVDEASDDARLMSLDAMTAEQWMDIEGFDSRRLRWLVDYACRDDYGTRLEDTSAWAAIFYFASRLLEDESSMPLLTWPEGNGALIAHLARHARFEMRTMVVDVVPTDEGVRVHSLREGKAHVHEAAHVIVAAPSFVAQRIVRPLRDAKVEAPPYGAWLVANLHLSERPRGVGYPTAWDNVLYDSPSLGYVVATHQRGREAGPTVWTYFLPFNDEDPRRGRALLLQPTWEELRDVIVADLARAHPDLPRLLERLDVWRWGHGMVQPRPGVIASRRRAKRRIGNVLLAHTDLSGVALFEEAFHHGVSAADAVVLG